MKRLGLFITICTMALSQSFAQSADSVKVRLRTSAGAEIGIDGDQSSTNLLTKKVPVGSHTVTVTYGTSYKKDFPVNVSHANHEFDFMIDGQLSVSSQPAGRNLYIDGIPQGRTPATLNLVGDHNLRIEGDKMSYFDVNERVTVRPFEQVERDFVMKKRPPRTYGMVLFNYMPVSGSPAFGLTFAIVKRWGVYARTTFSTGGNDGDGGKDDSKMMGDQGPGYYKKDADNYWALNAGLIFRLSKNIYAYAGSGYGEYKRSMKVVETGGSYYYNGGMLTPYYSEGAMVDAGVILKWKALIGQVGYNRIMGSGKPDPFSSIYVGLGITIHKQKKDKL